jgi:uncharacterized protein (TIGR02145 family)
VSVALPAEKTISNMKIKKIISLTLTLIALFSFGKQNNIQSQNSAITDEGVVINGIRWATRNVGETPKTFAEKPENSGGYYSWNEAQDACPDGWRVPTEEELRTLAKARNRWTTTNRVHGRLFGTFTNTVFLPATGFRDGNTDAFINIGSNGYYWSGTYNVNTRSLFFNSSMVDLGNHYRADKFSVRCVAK